ncbi:MAG: bifunctional proline dehydrogenase/L-glutamate gamma-semialdehyde dehydrogenase PutA [SAR86 cluster bacterium]|nr:bifunctional proline dehydrogenase/L-glutamate gamma-semialdehyde dehydrogenase PutA [SAR86 cluster bacterium]
MSISRNKFQSENELIQSMIEDSNFISNSKIVDNAKKIIDECRVAKSERTMLDAFLSEYGLSNNEGVALMCLAESVLRIPDKSTRDLIISEKLSEGRWIEHLNKADSIFVNASTWGLLLAGTLVKPSELSNNNPAKYIGGLVSKSGEMPIRNAVLAAMHILSKEFVMGRDFKDISKLKNIDQNTYSFDMLGEAARTDHQAEKYFQAYLEAIEEVSKINEKTGNKNGVSIKLSALYPRYETRKIERVREFLSKRLLKLIHSAIKKNVEITIDAEEQDRLSLSIEILEEVLMSEGVKDWESIGLAIQAYGKRSLDLIDWVEAMLEKRAPMHARLVKGAYWDYEIKNSQVFGHEGYSVFTKKAHTDISYLACAEKMLSIKNLLPKFATHNAHTIAAIHQMSDQANFEYQRLYGMGELLYKSAESVLGKNNKTTIYAPIGKYKDLLPYLVRRLLENGANSSFINRLLDPETDSLWLAESPVKKIAEESKEIPMPINIFNDRLNSKGLDLSEQVNLDKLKGYLKNFDGKTKKVESVYGGRNPSSSEKHTFNSLSNGSEIGSAYFDSSESIEKAFSNYKKSSWSKTSVVHRAEVLKKIANFIENNPNELLYYLIHEAGKHIEDAVDEIREAVDFLRYYSEEAVKLQASSNKLNGPTGEENALTYHPRGRFLCISPWNFPVAILIGQISAALATGNDVISKPSEHTPILASIITNIFHSQGVPEDALQLVLGDGLNGATLTKSEGLKGVAFTGSTETARKIQSSLLDNHKEIIKFIAETGGLNCMIVDSSALLEQVTDDVMRSAFNSAGQRCSALRVLIVQEDIYQEVIDMVTGAMKVLDIGPTENFNNDIGPIISKDAFEKLKDYIEAASIDGKNVIQPHDYIDNKYIPPTMIEIKSLSELESEQFGPILHIMKFKAGKIQGVVEEINKLNYGLTLGVHTRVESRADEIAHAANVGNVYINRDIVGAVVGVQPFGGEGLSGTGCKAGGPNYLSQFVNEQVVSKNIVAFGGNTELLNLQNEE